MSTKTHKSQHYVPRSYTGAWADPDTPDNMEPYVWLFEVESRTGKRKAPKNVFEETDLYTIERADGTRDLVLEHGLSELESRFAGIRRKLANRDELSIDDYFYLLVFVAAMDGRTKSQRDHERQQWGKVKELMDVMIAHVERTESDGRRDSPLEILSAAYEDDPGMTYDEVTALANRPLQITLPISVRTVTPIYAQMNVAILQTESEIGFITSDSPVVTCDPEAYKRPPMFRSPALMRRSTEVTFPVSPQQLLMLTWHSMTGYIAVEDHVVDTLNRRTRLYADEHFVVRRNETKDAWFETPAEPEDSWEKTRATWRQQTAPIESESSADDES